MKKIFLTGGTGFFGKSILDMLEQGFMSDTSFVILSRNPDKFLQKYPQYSKIKRVSFAAGDIRSFDFPQEQFDEIIHAATPAVTTITDDEMRSIIIDGTKRVIEFASICKAKKLLFVSSGAVYGSQKEYTNIPENAPCNPVSAYGSANLEAEKMCSESSINSLIARCFAFVGPHLELDIHFAIGNFIRDAINGNDIIIKGDGTPHRSYMYSDDLVKWLFTILEKGKFNHPYNVGSPQSVSIAELANQVAKAFPKPPKVKILTPPTPGAIPIRYVPDISRAEKELDLKITIPLDRAIRKTIDSHL